MKKAISLVLVVALAASLSACARDMTICGTTYTSYGVLNESEKKNPDVAYEVSIGNIFWGVVLAETVIAPIYFFGFSLFNPVGPKPKVKGAVPSKGNCQNMAHAE